MAKKFEDCPKYLNSFLTHIRVIKDRTERTVEAYYIDIRTFLRYLKLQHGDVDPSETSWNDITIADVPFDYVAEVTLVDAYAYMKWLSDERHNSAKTRSRKTSALKQFYHYLADKAMLLESDPLTNLELPRSHKSLPKYLTLEDAQRLLMSIETDNFPRDYCMITLFLNCGMRLSELCGLDIGDISFQNGTIRLFGKGRKERIVYMNGACIAALKNYMAVRDAIKTDDKALFLSNRKTRITRRRVQQIVEECLKQAGLSNLGITTHKLRHTAATLMYQYGGVDTLVLKEILGHESLSTTEIYTHLSSDSMKTAADANPLAGERLKRRKKGLGDDK